MLYRRLLQITWNPLPNTCYSISKNEQMTTEIVTLWFENFTKQIQEHPLLVISDEHLTHVLLEQTGRAIKNKSQ